MLGVTSAWIGDLDALVPYKTLFVLATMVLLGYGFYAAYRRKPRCDSASCSKRSGLRVSLWVGLVIAVGGLAFAQVQSLLMTLR